jgi:hypothetical protein
MKRISIYVIFSFILIITGCSPIDSVVGIYNETSYDLQIKIKFIDYDYLEGNNSFIVNAGKVISFNLDLGSFRNQNIVVKKIEFVDLNNNVIGKTTYIDLNSIIHNIKIMNLNSGEIIKILYFDNDVEVIKFVYKERGVSFYDLKINYNILK